MSLSIEALPPSPDLLGECPLWNERTGHFYWVDSIAPKIRCYDPSTGHVKEWTMPSPVGSIGFTESDTHLIAALTDGFYELDLSNGALRHLASPAQGDSKARFNDGRMDRAGRFLSGTLVPHGHPELGKLYRLNHDLSIDQLESGMHVSNTLCFSPRGDVLYFSDTLNRQIWAYDYDNETGQTRNRRVLIDTSIMKSGTDGASVDSDGCLWVAMVEVGRIARITPDGRLDRLIALPLEYPSCTAFGGSKLDVLYVTSIRESGSGRLVGKLPTSGKVLMLHHLGVTGLPEPRFKRTGLKPS